MPSSASSTRIPLSLALTSLVGYAFQITYVLPFSLGSQMALHTSAAFLRLRHRDAGLRLEVCGARTGGLAEVGRAASAWRCCRCCWWVPSALFPEQSWRAVPLKALFSVLGVALVTLAVQRLTTVRVAYKGLLMIAVPLILLLTFVGLVVHVKRPERVGSSRWRCTRQKSSASPQSLLTHIAEAESAVRGYVVTGDDTFVRSLRESAGLATQTTAQLRQLVERQSAARTRTPAGSSS